MRMHTGIEWQLVRFVSDLSTAALGIYCPMRGSYMIQYHPFDIIDELNSRRRVDCVASHFVMNGRGGRITGRDKA
jgi:hypothetical protein